MKRKYRFKKLTLSESLMTWRPPGALGIRLLRPNSDIASYKFSDICSSKAKFLQGSTLSSPHSKAEKSVYGGLIKRQAPHVS